MLDVHRKCNANGNDPRAGCCDNVLPSDIIIIYQVYNMYRTTLLYALWVLQRLVASSCPNIYNPKKKVEGHAPKQPETSYLVLRDSTAECDGGENERGGELEHPF